MNLDDAKMYALVNNRRKCGCDEIYRLVQKHDTEANWNKAVNFKPKAGELIVYDVDATHNAPRLKVGDGKTVVFDLPFFFEGALEELSAKLDKEILDRIKAVSNAIKIAAEDATKKANVAELNANTYTDNAVTTLSTEIQTKLDTKYDKTGGTVGGSVTITGDLTVNGTQHINNTENLNVENAMIYSNANGAALATNGGIGIKTNSTDVYGIVYDPNADSVKLGLGKSDSNGVFTFNTDEGEPVAVRDDSSKLTNNHLIKWDSANNKLSDGGKAVDDLSTATNLENGEGVGSIKIAKGGNSARGAFAFASGYYSSANGDSTFSGGYFSKADIEHSISYGYSTRTENGVLAAFGKYNNPTSGHLFEVGSGTSDNRSNAFAVLTDGRAKVRTAPKDNDDVVRKQELDNSWNEFNLENGTGEGSLNQKGYYRDGEYKEGGSALGKSSVALNKHTTAYMVGDTAIGGSTVAGMTEDEFNAYYWDSTNNRPLHEGKGLINNKITDNEGRDYTQAVSCAFASGDATTAKYRCSFASGSRVNTSDKEQAVFGAFVGRGGNYISDSRYKDEDMRFIVGCGNDWSTSGNRFALAKRTGHAYFPQKITIKNNAEDDMDVPSYKQMKDYADAAAKNYIYPSKDIYALKWYSNIVTRRGFNVGANEGAQANKITAGWYGLVGGNNSTNRQTDSLVFGQYLEGSGTNDSSGIARAGSATLGAFNIRNDDAVLTIGNGLDTNRRSNAFTVLWDGRAEVLTAPKSENDVVRKKELDTKLDMAGGTINGSLIIANDLTVQGKTTSVDTQSLKVADKLIYVARDNTTALTSPAGLIIPKYDGTNNGGIVYDSTGTAYVGDISLDSNGNVDVDNSDLVALAARSATIADGNIVKWNNTNLTLVDTGINVDNVAKKTELDNKVDKVTGKGLSSNDFTDAEKTKLAGIAEGANNYELPVASATAIGGVKPGTTSGKNYGVAVDTNGEMTVNVPWTDNNTVTTVSTTANGGLKVVKTNDDYKVDIDEDVVFVFDCGSSTVIV